MLDRYHLALLARVESSCCSFRCLLISLFSDRQAYIASIVIGVEHVRSLLISLFIVHPTILFHVRVHVLECGYKTSRESLSNSAPLYRAANAVSRSF